MSDDYALGAESDAVEHEEEEEVETETDKDKVNQSSRFCGIKIKTSYIPYIMFTSDVVTALGSGMTIKFVGNENIDL